MASSRSTCLASSADTYAPCTPATDNATCELDTVAPRQSWLSHDQRSRYRMLLLDRAQHSQATGPRSAIVLAPTSLALASHTKPPARHANGPASPDRPCRRAHPQPCSPAQKATSGPANTVRLGP